MKSLKRGALVVVALVVIAAIAVFLGLGRIVKGAVEREGTRSLVLATTLDIARVSVLGGKLGLHGLSIASPHGFSAPKMLELGKVDVSVRYGELRKNPVHIDSLAIENPRFVIEQSGGALNFHKAMGMMPPGDSKGPPLKMIIDQLTVRDAHVIFRPGLPGVDREIDVAVPALAMKDVGRGKGSHNGAAMKDVAMELMTALAASAAQSSAVPAPVKALLRLDALARDPVRALQDLMPAGRSIPAPHR